MSGTRGWNGKVLLPSEVADAIAIEFFLTGVRPDRDRKDKRRWIPEHSDMFSVRSTYSFLQNMSITPIIEPGVISALQRIWLNGVPTKVDIIIFEERWNHFNLFGTLVKHNKR
ncbi:hypothetical protein L195_g028124, partial [Trifolium pratense]